MELLILRSIFFFWELNRELIHLAFEKEASLWFREVFPGLDSEKGLLGLHPLRMSLPGNGEPLRRHLECISGHDTKKHNRSLISKYTNCLFSAKRKWPGKEE